MFDDFDDRIFNVLKRAIGDDRYQSLVSFGRVLGSKNSMQLVRDAMVHCNDSLKKHPGGINSSAEIEGFLENVRAVMSDIEQEKKSRWFFRE